MPHLPKEDGSVRVLLSAYSQAAPVPCTLQGSHEARDSGARNETEEKVQDKHTVLQVPGDAHRIQHHITSSGNCWY